MINISNLTFNSNSISSLSYNNSEVNTLIFKNLYNWQVEGELEFIISPLLMQSTGEILNVSISPSYSNNTNVYITGNHIMFCRTQNCLPKDIIINSGNVSFDKLAVDNYGMMLSRIYSRGNWPGGTSSNMFNVNTTFSVGNQSCNKFNFISQVDENNTCFLKDLFTTNVIRVPSTGFTNFSLNYYLYPYDFDSNLFSYDVNNLYSSDPVYHVFEIDNNSRNMQTQMTSRQDIINNTIFSDINLSSQETVVTLTCSIENNSTNNYREVGIIFGDTLVHFIQEPYNQNRIYYNKYKPYYSPSIDYSSSETLFQEMESYVLQDQYEINSTLDDYLILLPENLENRYTITWNSSSGVLYPINQDNNIYSWSGINYKCYGCGSNQLTFTRK